MVARRSSGQKSRAPVERGGDRGWDRLQPGQGKRALRPDISPALAVGGPTLYRLRVEPGRDFGLTNAAIAATGAEIVSRDGDALTVLADGAQVQAIAQVADVAWIENWLLREKHNEAGGGADHRRGDG